MANKDNKFFTAPPTAPVQNDDFNSQSFGAPVSGDVGYTMPSENPFSFSGNPTTPIDSIDATEPVSMNGVAGFTPVVGWLVCIEGPAEGCDYRIRAGYNYIGRGENMDICIQGDNNIGRERHAMIAYDPQEKIYFFGPADSRSIVRKNDKMVMVPVELAAYDVLCIGSTKLMFVPLCGEHFNW